MANAIIQLRSVNPATGEEIETFRVADERQIDAVLDASTRAARQWAATPLYERSALLRQLATILRRDVEAHASVITAEMGKTLTEARAEVDKCAFGCDYFADNAAAFLANEPSPSDSPSSYIAFEPLGTILA